MLIIVPTWEIIGGVKVEETVSILHLDFNAIKKISEDKDTGDTQLTYHSGQTEVISLPFVMMAKKIADIHGLAIPDFSSIAKISPNVHTMLKTLTVTQR